MTTANTIQIHTLDTMLRSVWRRTQLMHLASGTLALFRWAIPLFAIGVFIDWMTYMPTIGRLGLVIIIVGVSLYRAWRCGWRSLRTFNAVHTALLLEKQNNQLNSLLISAIQLRNQPNTGGDSSALRHHTCQLANQAAQAISPRSTVPYRPLQQPAVIALVLGAAIALAGVVNGPFLGVGLARIFNPWVLTGYPTNTQITLHDAELIVQEGKRAEIQASIAGVVPKQATLYVRTGDGRPRAIDLDITQDQCTYTIDAASRDFTYRLKAGDDRTDWHRVRVIPAPRISEVNVTLKYPDYMDRAPETAEALTLTVPEATQVHWQLTLDRPVRAAQFIRDGEEARELELSADGRTLSFTQTAQASRGYSFAWTDKAYDFHFTSPRYYLQVATDQPPRVELTYPGNNLAAMIGRPLNLSLRAQDDHGIGSAAVTYRVNQREETAVTIQDLDLNRAGEQQLDWDYRQALPDLAIGDTLTLAVEVQDRYTGAQGPHTARSEARRITFLSEEQYLEQINKQKDRLLSRVQTLYRQQRAAHENVRTLSPDDAGYAQACQLEAIRQEMAREQLETIAQQIQDLLDDLEANGMGDALAGESLDQVRQALLAIAGTTLAEAASRLREQSAVAGKQAKDRDPANAADAVNTSARELAKLVMQRGIDAAQEVFARETRMLAQAQANLRWPTANQPAPQRAGQLAARQDELAQWTDALIADLQSSMRYDRRPLAVLRLTRSVKELAHAQTADQMREVGTALRGGAFEQAGEVQAELVRRLLGAEFSVRLSGAYSTLLDARGTVDFLTQAQQQLHDQLAAMSPSQLDAKRDEAVQVQDQLRRQLLTLLLPTIPAPQASLFDEVWPQAPPVAALMSQIDRSMSGAVASLREGQRDSANSHQREAQAKLAELGGIVEAWSVQLGMQTQGLGTLVAESSERMTRLQAFEVQAIGMLEATDLAVADEQPLDGLVERQLLLAGEVSGFMKELARSYAVKPDADLPPVMRRVDEAAGFLNEAVKALRDRDADRAMQLQESSADALMHAYTVVTAQNERLTLLQDLVMFQRSVGFANGYMADIVAEQRDLLEATEASQPNAMIGLLPAFGNMHKCLMDVAPLLDLIAARLDVGTPLAFARTDFEDAMQSLETGDKFNAVDALDVASESLANVQGLVSEIQSQTGYVAEIVAFLHASISQTLSIQFEQQTLAQQLQSLQGEDLEPVLAAQQALLNRAASLSKDLVSATGMPDFNEASGHMGLAVDRLKAKDPAGALALMQQADETMSRDGESLLAVITMLHGLPSLELSSLTAPELVRLIDVLALASQQQAVYRETPTTPSREALATRQAALAERCKAIAQASPHALLVSAGQSLAQAASALGGSGDEALRSHQRLADERLRHFIVEQALILETAVPPVSASPGEPEADGPGSDSESDYTAGFIADFVSGEVPQDKRSEWKVLADRNRAALNQNFARELPLEYRGLLKNYYERVAQ